MKINTLILAFILVGLNVCNKDDYEITSINKPGALVYVSEQTSFPFNTAMLSTYPAKINGTPMEMDAAGEWVFRADPYIVW